MMSMLARIGAAILVAAAILLWWQYRPIQPAEWTDAELVLLQSLSLASLPELPPDPTNAVADNPLAAQFGQQLFFDPRLSANGGISCATCHQPIRRFTDGLPKGQAIGTSRRNTPSIVGTAYSPWLYWDGRRDSQWSQALSPLEDPAEHGSNRQAIVGVLAADVAYAATYAALFGPLPDPATADAAAIDRAFANAGKALAAFERTLLPTNSRFDDYVAAVMAGDARRADGLFSADEVLGLRLFNGKANCTQCHNGPLLTNNEFHNTGLLNFPGDVPDQGRAVGVAEVFADPFNCLGDFSDDPNHRCAELEFARTGIELVGAFRTPSLRNIENTAPYMHAGQLETLTAVLEHYNVAAEAMIGHNEATPLDLSQRELRQLESFLHTLAAPVAMPVTE